MATAENSITVLHKEFGVIRRNISNLELENAKLWKKLKKSSKTHAKTTTGLDMELGESRDDMRKKTRKFGAHRAKVDKLEKGLEVLRDAPKKNERR